MSKIANLRGIGYAPLVNASDIKAFEAYARTQVQSFDLNTSNLLLSRPPGCNSSTCGWIVSDGIYMLKNGASIPTSEYISDTSYPHTHFPLWQIAPLKEFTRAVMLDMHASDGPRKVAIDEVLRTKSAAITDFVQLVADRSLKPSSVMYGPITNEGNPDNPVIGLFVGIFSFDENPILLLKTFLVCKATASPESII